ncbi:MAG TPA: peptide-methionine (S)-S-oxide reductase MsrA [Thermodesulfobacteriota bacterium]
MGTKGTEKAVFAAGCFWGVEETFRTVEGVTSTRVGYTGGTKVKPTYEDVCRHDTGHAEAVEVTFDPERVSYRELLNIFWDIHDPTTLNRQGPDVGSQYRSAIFYTTPGQEQEAKGSLREIEKSGIYGRPIVTEIAAVSEFYEAEDYHQKYLMKRGRKYCG